MSKNHNSATFAAKLRIYSELTNKLPEKVVSLRRNTMEKMGKDIRKDIVHSMKRRSQAHNWWKT